MSEASESSTWARIQRSARVAPADVTLVVGFTLVVAGIVTTGPESVPLRSFLAVPLLLVFPGYSLQAVLFPGQDGDRAISVFGLSGYGDPLGNPTGHTGTHLSLVERLWLSVGTSVFVVPLVGIGLGAGGVALTAGTVVVSLSVLVVVAMVVAWILRSRLPQQHRFVLPVDRWFGTLSGTVTGDEASGLDASTVLVGIAALLAVSALVVGLLVPANAEAYTGLQLLTTGENGTLVADGYPESIPANGSAALTVAVQNREREPVDYSVVVQLQRVESGEDLTVTERREVTTFHNTVPANGTWERPHRVRPPMTGDELRLTYLLYRDEVPDQPSVDNAYRHTYIWVNVTG